jgi:nucleoside-diphosphate-sugar epimerase
MAGVSRVLVTGASGFLGRPCVAALTARGFEVHGTGRGAPPRGLTGLQWHAADLLSKSQRRELVGQLRPTHLVHLAWEARPGHYRDSLDNPAWAEASLDLLDRALALGTERIIGIGTCFEYGASSGPCDEATTCHPINSYGRAKLSVAEGFAAAAGNGAGAAWGRVFIPFGPGEQSAKLIPSLIRSLAAGREFDCSHGQQVRDFIYIEDLADAIAAVLESELTGVVNLASGEPRSLHSVIAHFARLLGAEDRIRYGAREASGLDAEPMIIADVSRLRRETGWAPRIGWEEGAGRTVDWWRGYGEDAPS